jgi:Uncharacterized protein conserved in bacteria
MKKSILVLALMNFFVVLSWSQDTIYIAKNGVEVKDRKLMDDYMFIQKDSDNKNKAVISRYFNSGKLKWRVGAINERALKQGEYKTGLQALYMHDDIRWLFDGPVKEYYESGTLYHEGEYDYGGSVGEVRYYWENAVLKRKEIYDPKNWKMDSGECFDQNGKKTAYFPIYQPCEYKNGKTESLYQYFYSKLEYPKNAISRRAEKKMGVFIDYDNEGNCINAFVRHPVDPDLDSAVICLAKSVKKLDKPATLDGKPYAQQLLFVFNYNIPYFAYDIVNNATGIDSVYLDKSGMLISNAKKAYNVLLFKPSLNSKDDVNYKTFDQHRNLVSMSHISKSEFNDSFKLYFKNPYKITLMTTKRIIETCINASKQLDEFNNNLPTQSDNNSF